MQKLSCDTLIIGAGSAGLEAFRAASGAGAHCIIVESGPLGTTAQRVGDLPTALLTAAGHCARGMHNLPKFGVQVQGQMQLNTDEVMRSLRAVRARATTEILSFLYRIPEDQRLIGKAGFIDDHHAAVGSDYEIEFKTAVIATGSAPAVPYALNSLGGVLTVNDLFELDKLPRSAAIFGAGAAGLQIGQALAYLDADIVVFGEKRLWKLTDEPVLIAASDLLQENFNLEVNAEITAIERNDQGYGIYYLDEDNYENYLKVDTIISAQCWQARIDSLNLRELGLALHGDGRIKVDSKTMQCSKENFFAAGDVCSSLRSTGKAKREGALAGLNAARFPQLRHEEPGVHLDMIFTDPGIAIAGLCFDEMKERARNGHLFITSDARLNDGRYRAVRKEDGIIRLYFDKDSGKLMGSEICAPSADHVAHFLALAINQGMTAAQLAAFPFYQPTFEETIAKAALQACRNLARDPDFVYGIN